LTNNDKQSDSEPDSMNSKMRASRSATAVALILLGLPRPGPSAQQPRFVKAPLTADQQQVYADFIESMSSSKRFRIVSATTYPFDISVLDKNAPCLKDLKLQDPKNAQKTIHLLDPDILRKNPVRLVNADEEAGILRRKDAEAAAHPNAKEASIDDVDPGVLELSEIVFDKSRHFAVLKFVYRAGSHSNIADILVLEKLDSHWVGTARRPCKWSMNSAQTWP
jgi:hypothetical protein